MNTEIICIIDRSGSMESIRADAEGGFNRFLEDQKAVEGKAKVTLAIFDHEYEVIYQAQPLADVPVFKLIPRGATALYDAIGRTLERQAQRIAREHWADLVVVTVVTDGQENSSMEFPLRRVNEMIAHAEKNGWKFIWQAANLDAAHLAQSLGSAATMTNSVAPTAAGMASVSAYASTAVRSLRLGDSEDEANLLATTASAQALKDFAEAQQQGVSNTSQ